MAEETQTAAAVQAETTIKKRPVAMAILDGWGVSSVTEGNAIAAAKTPTMHRILREHPSMALQAAGTAVGLPWGEAGNSEVGHLNLGAGRIVFQEAPEVSTAIADGSFFANQVFIDAVEHVKKYESTLHFIGVLNPAEGEGGLAHVLALLKLAKQQDFSNVVVHVLLGKVGEEGSMKRYVESLQGKMAEIGIGNIGTVSGEYFAMDREKRWEHTGRAYRTMVDGLGQVEPSVDKVLEKAYEQNLPEEYVEPTIVEKPRPIGNNDSIIFFNWRPERSRQLAKSFVAPYFGQFEHGKPLKNLYLVTMTSFEHDMSVKSAFIANPVKDTMPELLSKAGLRQYHVAETEKFAHITTFFNGGHEGAFPGEIDDEVKSAEVRGYDELPEMSTQEVADKMVTAIRAERADFYLANLANLDMVGHTGNFQAATRAAEVVDAALGQIIEACQEKGLHLLITADHGNAEQMMSMQSGINNVDHSNNPVPLILISPDDIGLSGQDRSIMDGSLPAGMLADVAPTVLELFGIEKAEEMTGYSLLETPDKDDELL